MKHSKIKVFSMFSGVGGFELGFQQANLQTQVVGFCEIDKYASQILETKFKEIKNYGDATTIDETKLPNFDILVGGFPCQPFSMAGKRKGFDEARGTLFFDVARILAHKKPRNFILENVKGLLSHNKGKTFKTILGILSDLGYIVEWELLNSKNYGVPQSRERVYIVGHLRGQSQPKVFSFRKSTEKSNQKPKLLTKNLGQAQRVFSTNGVSVSIIALGGGQGAKTGLYEVKKGTQIRRLTPIECERLQGFPDNWTEGLSDTQRYKCLGNAVTTNVIEWIGKQLYEC